LSFNKEKFWDMFALLFWWALMFFGIMISFMGVSGFWVGYHNLDLGHNLQILECEGDVLLEDEFVFGGSIIPRDEYLLGLRLIIKNFFRSLLGVFLFGYGACGFLMSAGDLITRLHKIKGGC